MAYYQPSQVMVSGQRVPSKRDYVFTVQRGVSLAWVDAQDVTELRAMSGGCCGKRKRLFSYATEGQISIWTNGTRGPGGGGNTPCGRC
jgi:hypothetical protein